MALRLHVHGTIFMSGVPAQVYFFVGRHHANVAIDDPTTQRAVGSTVFGAQTNVVGVCVFVYLPQRELFAFGQVMRTVSHVVIIGGHFVRDTRVHTGTLVRVDFTHL